MRKNLTRRNFLKKAAAVSAGAIGFPFIISSSALGKAGAVAPGNRITVGFIGLGGHGIGCNLRGFLEQPDAQAVALCDVDTARIRRAVSTVEQKYGSDYRGYFTTQDWRDVIARDDIDAVMISTPDHWHVPISIAAAKAGKDVCCEKPTLTISEGRALVNAVKRYGRVFQTSTEDRAIHIYHRMAELVRNGRIGKLHTIRVKLPSGPNPGQIYGRTYQPQPVPKGFDYDMWLGPAPYAPYHPARCHGNFRWILDYSGGQLTDWGGHQLDIAQLGNNTEHTGPVEVEGEGIFPKQGLYNTATVYHIKYKYANGVTLFIGSGGADIQFEGTEGWVGNYGWRGKLQASSQSILDSVIGPNETHLYTCPGREHRNFLDCVKSRRAPYFPAETGHRCCTVAHLGNISMLLQRKLRWDPDKEEFPNDPEANRMLSRTMRSPWHL